MKLFKMVLVAGALLLAAPVFADESQSLQTEDFATLEAQGLSGETLLRPPPPRRRPPPPRRPPPRQPIPPRYGIWECQASHWANTWNLYRGMRSIYYAQAHNSAIEQCQYYERAVCVVRSCIQF